MTAEERRDIQEGLAAAAARFVEVALEPALCEASDGGLELMRAIVAAIFKSAAFHDAAGVVPEVAPQLLEVARRAIKEGQRG